LEIESFLHIEEVNDRDSVVSIYKSGDYFILHTIHNRIEMYRIEESEIMKVDIPSSFQRLGAASIVTELSADSNFIYFWHYIYDRLYVYDMQQQKFFTIEIERGHDELTEFLEDRIHRVRRDKNGNLFFQIRVDMNAYIRWREEEIERLEDQGIYMTGAAMFMHGDSIFHKIYVETIRELTSEN